MQTGLFGMAVIPFLCRGAWFSPKLSKISKSGKSSAEVISKLEEDATAVLKFMASNGLVANATKTTFLLKVLRVVLVQK